MFYIWMKEVLLIGSLSMVSVLDVLFYRIPWVFINLMIFFGVLLHLIDGDLLTAEVFLGLIPGLFCLTFSYLTREILGKGDGWLILGLGLYLKPGETAAVTIVSFLIAILGALLLIAVRRKKEIGVPFIPFLLAGVLIVRGVELCGL